MVPDILGRPAAGQRLASHVKKCPPISRSLQAQAVAEIAALSGTDADTHDPLRGSAYIVAAVEGLPGFDEGKYSN